jgi:hypothetical protein
MTTPGYPNGLIYNNDVDMECVWKLVTATGQKLTLSFPVVLKHNNTSDFIKVGSESYSYARK